MDWLPQIGIGLFGVLAIFLVSTKADGSDGGI